MIVRLVTYNIHKCKGWDGRISPERIARVLAPLEADFICLQEVIGPGTRGRAGQAQAIANALGNHYALAFGRARDIAGAEYGNATLARLPIESSQNYSITWERREPRGCLRTDLRLPSGELLHVFNVHLGTSFRERRWQGPKLLSDDVLADAAHTGPRVVVGDFNEWTRGVTSTIMAEQFQRANLEGPRRRRRTFPGLFPMLDLDHVYYDQTLVLERFYSVRSPLALLASDHLPLVAQFRIAA